MDKMIVSHGGYATETLFNCWWKLHSYKNWGILKIGNNGIELDGRNGYLNIPIYEIKKVNLVRKKFSYHVYYLLLITIMGFIFGYAKSLKFELINLILLSTILFAFLIINYYYSIWIEVVFLNKNIKEKLYFSVSWHVGFNPKWRMWTDGGVLSWQDNNRAYKILKVSLTENQNNSSTFSKITT